MNMIDYWSETFSCACEEAGMELPTSAQAIIAAKIIQGAAEVHGEYSGAYHVPNPIELENKSLQAALKKERNKTVCKTCWGEGRIIEQGVSHSSNSACYKCDGGGYVYGK